MKEQIKIILLVVVALPILFFFNSCAVFSEMKEFAENGVIYSPDLNMIADGEYTGEYKCGLVRAKVKVVIQNHSIVSFAILEHDNGKGGKAERIADDIVKAQSLNVDVISGATVSSKVILKAGERALAFEE
ncbi:MAG: FMN-binding protein [Spirochaetales bacterium]|nr:FMN-binding protein [Spirochaetales bacterium]